MTKARCPLTLHGLIERAFNQVGGKAAIPGILTHRTMNWVHNVLNPDRDESKRQRLTFEDAQILSDNGALCLAEDLARRCGMQLSPIGSGATTGQLQVMGHVGALMASVGLAAQSVTEAIADGEIDAGEEREIIDTALQVAEGAHHLTRAVKSFRAKGKG